MCFNLCGSTGDQDSMLVIQCPTSSWHCQELESLLSSPSPFPLGCTTGSPKRSPVWNFFWYDNVSNQSVCKVEVMATDNNEPGPAKKFCDNGVSGKFPADSKGHLKKPHPSWVWRGVSKFNEEKPTKPQKLRLRLAQLKPLAPRSSWPWPRPFKANVSTKGTASGTKTSQRG